MGIQEKSGGVGGIVRRVVAGSVLVAAPVNAQEDPPYLHLTRTAETPQAAAHFGYTAAAGRLEALTDARDDVVACAPHEDVGASDVGAGYIFLNQTLVVPTETEKRRILPLAGHAGQELGRLSVCIGNPRGSGYTNLILVSGFATTAEYCSETEAVVAAGSVEAYDFNDTEFEGLPVLSLLPPLNAGEGDCADLVPDEVMHFGTAIALADVTRDGTDDVIVGAPETDQGTRSQFGRIYIFSGHSSFTSAPYDAWIGLNAPESSESTRGGGTGFGCSIAAANLTDDLPSRKDIVVGRHDHNNQATGGDPEGGTAIVFRNKYLHDLFGGSTLNAVTDPVHTDELSTTIPEYQVLENPFSIIQPFGSGPYPHWQDWFGWVVYSVGDVGSPNGTFDGIDDIIVHAEDTDFIGEGEPDDPDVPKAGACFVYYGTGVPDDTTLVHPEHTLLMAPTNTGGPESFARFGRALAKANWYNGLEEETQPALFISDIDASVGSTLHAGKVYMIRLPLPEQPEDEGEPAAIANAWGSSPLTEPGGAVLRGLFGSWIVALDYIGNQQDQPGQQILISARQSTASSSVQAGKFYTFTPLEP